MPSFSWTQYSFRNPSGPLSPEAWFALRAAGPEEHETIIDAIKRERWSQFWKDQAFFKWCLWILAAGVVLFIAAEEKSGLRVIATLVILLMCLVPVSVMMSAASHASALNKQCRYLRAEFSKAASSAGYEEYLTQFLSPVQTAN